VLTNVVMRLGVLSSSLLALLSCSSDPAGTLQITTGEETDVFTRAPAPALLTVDSLAQDRTSTEIARATLPASTIDLGRRDQSTIAAISVRGLDAVGATLIRGETLYVELGALKGSTLDVFVQRSGELARMPSGPLAIAATKATVTVGRYVLLTAGTTGTLYDLLNLTTLASTPVLPRAAKSVATVGTIVLLVDDTGATTLDLSDSSTSEIAAPSNGTYAEVAGGDRFGASDTTQYIVGATRPSGDPTARILVVATSNAASFAGLTAPRAGACAVYVNGRGLLVYGGSGTAAGAELLAPGSTLAAPLPIPPDAVHGCGATLLDSTHVLIVGGTGATGDTGAGLPARVLDLTCTTNCAPVAWPDVVKLTTAQVQPLAADAAFVLGDDAAGNTHAYRISAAAGMREITLKAPRQGGKLVYSPTGAVHVVGGNAAGVEQYLE